MGWITYNVKHNSCCAFCKYWYDPTNSDISPVMPAQGMWKINMQSRNLCTLRNIKPTATHKCEKYQCKI